ncbi:hypothetical protein [Klebsiella phage Kpn02]|uniref:Uncharacterized protein n=1 Tax=Klebsiella phage Kpn02 TaxID=3044023 RepID=A0AAT9V5M8_9CAUD|nr:hypothetical protein [Klebsiella phage Kpn02]
MIVFLTSLCKRKSFSFAFNFSNANRSHSYLHFRPPALALRLCANPTMCQAKYYMRMLGYVQIRQ